VRVESPPVRKDILVSAFVNEGERRDTIVAINPGDEARDVTITVDGLPDGVTMFERFGATPAASGPGDGVPVVNKNQLATNLPAQSIATLHASYRTR